MLSRPTIQVKRTATPPKPTKRKKRRKKSKKPKDARMDQLFSAFDGEEELDATTQLPATEQTQKQKQETKPKSSSNSSSSSSGVVKNDEKRARDDGTSPQDDQEPAEKKQKADEDQEQEQQQHDVNVEQQVAVEGNSNMIKKHDKPAKTYPFELDGFQKEAIGYLERNESVLVAAHTSAGKTVVAEYAVAMALRDKQRVVYTSPIKALSNQKYRDLAEEFSDVGLMTGDVTINPNASCLVMTTEILRSMLYRGAEVVREVAYVIFDEVHYMRDRERGVVYEETICLLPHKVRYVFLSATIPNAQEFCDWISKIHHQPCHVVYTSYRPTPLQHFVYPAGSTGVYLIVDEKSKFHDDTFQQAMSTLASTNLEDDVADGMAKSKEARQKQNARRRDKMGDLLSIIQMIMKRGYDPAIVFSFSKKDCEKYAAQISKLTLNTPEDKEMVTRVFNSAIDALSEADKELPQVRSLLPLLEKGIGIHHGGLLPILKEVTEILFGEGLIKVLFATETFAMGINMPAKTVVFTAMRKYDGSDFRWLNPGEYIQMSGRAGRRGLDDRGIVIQMMDEQMEPALAKEIMSGSANPLTSSFRITYNMLLNLLRVEDADPDFVVRNSLYKFQQERAYPKLQAQLKELEAKHSMIKVEDEDKLQRYHSVANQISEVTQKLNSITMVPEKIVPFLKPGRLVLTTSYSWAVVVQRMERNDFVKTIVACDPGDPNLPYPIGPDDKPVAGKRAEPGIRILPLTEIKSVSSLRIHTPTNMINESGQQTVVRSLMEVLNRFGTKAVPELDPKDDLKISNPNLETLIKKRAHLKELFAKDEINNMEDTEKRAEMCALFMEKFNLRVQIRTLKKEMKETKALPLRDKLAGMKTVLRRLGHVDKDNVIQLKGRVGCEISTADELVVTELLLGGAFNDQTPAKAAAMLSCMVMTEPGENENPLSPELAALYRTVQTAAKRVAQVQNDSNINTDVEEFAKQFRSDLMEPVLKWCQGSKFSAICELTSVFEGSIIRCVRRLVELLRQLCVASRVIGDASLEQTFTKAIELMKRDIIFAASLYL